jgi:hypothetical protein
MAPSWGRRPSLYSPNPNPNPNPNWKALPVFAGWAMVRENGEASFSEKCFGETWEPRYLALESTELYVFPTAEQCEA